MTQPEDRPLRICHVISSFRPVIGGAERATETLTRALIEHGEDVVVLTRRYSSADAPFEMIGGVPVHRLGLPGRSKWHALTFAAHALARLIGPLRSYRVLHVQNIDTPMIVGLIARVLTGRRLVATIHGETQLIGRGRGWRGRIRLRAMARLTDRVTSINPENTRALVRCGVKPDHIREIPNGVDATVFRPPSDAERAAARAALGLSDDEFVALYLGRLRPFKRVDLLIEAWSRLSPRPPARLIIVGGGPEEQRLRTLAAGLDSIRFEGPTDDSITYLRTADVFVNPSGDPATGWQEGLSVALLEAAFVGVPAIVTTGPGNDVVVEDQVTGWSFPVGDRDGLMLCLRLAIEDAELRARLGRQARAKVVDAYSVAAVARQVSHLYSELVRQA
jgi:glycosyltransferase involved in cell wall biosynthesis